MKRKLMMILASLALLAMTALVASADSPRFSRVGSSADSTTGALTVTFRETGLGNTPDPVDYTLTGSVSATYVCVNNGGNHPKASNKETVNSTFSEGASFLPENGVVNGSITTQPPSAGSFSCPGGQELLLACVTYSNITITDTDHNVSTSAPDASASPNGQFCR